MSDSSDQDSTPLRSFRSLVGPGLAAIPVIGGPLSALWSQWDAKRRFERIDSALTELTRILTTQQAQLTIEELADDEMQLLEFALQAVQHAHTEERRKQFARLVAHCWTDMQALPFDERMLFVQALSDFNDMHLRTLAILNNAGTGGSVPYELIRSEVASSLPNDIERDSVLVPALETLAARYGFIRRAWGLNDPNANSGRVLSRNLGPEGIARGCKHAITPLGQRFLASLSDPGA